MLASESKVTVSKWILSHRRNPHPCGSTRTKRFILLSCRRPTPTNDGRDGHAAAVSLHLPSVDPEAKHLAL